MTDTKQRIVLFIAKYQPVTVKKITEFFGINKTIIHRHLKTLIEQDKIYKEGSPPKVLYYARGGLDLEINAEKGLFIFTLRNNGKVLTKTEKYIVPEFMNDKSFLDKVSLLVVEYIEKEYLLEGKKITSRHLFSIFARVYLENDKNLHKQFQKYLQKNFSDEIVEQHTERFYAVFFTLTQHMIDQGWLDASIKLDSLKSLYEACHEKIYLDALYYAGIDKIDAQKTHDYEKMERIKEFQDERDIEDYYAEIFSEKFAMFLKEQKIDTLLIVPNNVKRQISFNEYIATHLARDYPHLAQISVLTNNFPGRKPQKKVSGVCKRLENATKLFDIDEQTIQGIEQNILIIDDVFGSGATMNTITKKTKNLIPHARCIGFSLLGSYRKGFDVISGI